MNSQHHAMPCRARRGERGMTLVETLVVVLLVSLTVGVVSTSTLRWMRIEQLRGATYQTYVQMSKARVEAARRNRPCRVVVDVGAGTLRVLDLNDPGTATDDEELTMVRLDPSVRFGLPGGGGGAVTLNPLAGSMFETTFDADGSVVSGTGFVAYQGDAAFRRVSVFAGGSIVIERWDGSAWTSGS